MTKIKLDKGRTFRKTPGVHFADITIRESCYLDLVKHYGPSTSPPDIGGYKQWYVHKHQTDNNRVVHGQRLFELYNPSWEKAHWLVFLTDESGALEIPAGTYHRSLSGTSGSVLLNHAVRGDEYDENKEFNAVIVPEASSVRTLYHGITQYAADFFIKHRRLP